VKRVEGAKEDSDFTFWIKAPSDTRYDAAEYHCTQKQAEAHQKSFTAGMPVVAAAVTRILAASANIMFQLRLPSARLNKMTAIYCAPRDAIVNAIQHGAV